MQHCSSGAAFGADSVRGSRQTIVEASLLRQQQQQACLKVVQGKASMYAKWQYCACAPLKPDVLCHNTYHSDAFLSLYTCGNRHTHARLCIVLWCCVSVVSVRARSLLLLLLLLLLVRLLLNRLWVLAFTVGLCSCSPCCSCLLLQPAAAYSCKAL